MTHSAHAIHTCTPAHLNERIRTIDHLRAAASTRKHEPMRAYIPTPCPHPDPFSARNVLQPRSFTTPTPRMHCNAGKSSSLELQASFRHPEHLQIWKLGAHLGVAISQTLAKAPRWCLSLLPAQQHRPKPFSRPRRHGDESKGKGPNNHSRAETPETPVMLWSSSMACSTLTHQASILQASSAP